MGFVKRNLYCLMNTIINKTKLQTAAAALAIAAMMLGMLPIQAFAQSASPYGEVPQTSVSICHAEGNGSFQTISPNASGSGSNLNLQGHENTRGVHVSDIIPPFFWLNNQNVTQFYPGKNWTTQNQATWSNGCVVPAPQPTTGTLTVTKIISGITGIAANLFGYSINNGASVAFQTDGSNDNTVNLGAYTVVESGVSNNQVVVGQNTYSVSYSGCSGTISSTPSLCTITNTYVPPTPTKGTIVVDKVTVPAADPQSFAFTTTGTGFVGFSLTDTATPNSQATLVAGTYSVAETAVAGWAQTSATCVSSTNGTEAPGAISLQAGEVVTCTFTNTKNAPGKGTIIVDKVTNPAADTQAFAFTTTGTGYTGFSLADLGAPNTQQLDAGTYTVSETSFAGWTPTGPVCLSSIQDTEISSALELDAGETITCTFTNTKDATPNELGCTNPAATNYNKAATSGNAQAEDCDFNYQSVCIAPGTNLLLNPSFEDPVADLNSFGAGYWEIFASIPNWATTNGIELWNNMLNGDTNGAQSAELDTTASSVITQTVTTIPGATYELRFDFAARLDNPSESENSIIAAADTVSVVTASTNNTNWTTYGGIFTADASTNISFADNGVSNSVGTVIDNTVLCLVSEQAPVDYCPNIKGNQTANEGYLKDDNGQCYKPITSCSVNVVSNSSNTYNDLASVEIVANPAWVQTIAGSLAKWIWGVPSTTLIDPVIDEVQTFKKTFVWSGTPSTAILKISSDNGYSVKLNGTVVGADAGEFNYQSLDTIINLTDDIIVGVNTLEISVTNKANGQTSLNSNPGGLLYDLTVTNTAGNCAPGGGGDDDEVLGCIDEEASNYNPLATEDDGSCTYDAELYRIYGYSWHDDNQNQNWDGIDDDEEGNEEDDLSGWTISITNGSATFETVTDEEGYYFFDVPAGTWTITEEVEGGWLQTTQESHEVTVPAVPVVTFLDSVINFIIPTAYAQIPTPDLYGPYNFGNDRRGGGGGGGGGGGTRVDRNPDGEVLGDSDSPAPLVLGEQTSVVPTGAPDTGRGGSATVVFGQFLALPRRRNVS